MCQSLRGVHVCMSYFVYLRSHNRKELDGALFVGFVMPESNSKTFNLQPRLGDGKNFQNPPTPQKTPPEISNPPNVPNR